MLEPPGPASQQQFMPEWEVQVQASKSANPSAAAAAAYLHGPLFTVVLVHYQGVVPHEIFLRGLQSIQQQTFGDFELLCYHDGPLLDKNIVFPVPVTCTSQRFNDWGHSLRDLGIHKARGQYILHFNADNVLYPKALEVLAHEIRRPARLIDRAGHDIDTNDVIIFPIKMWNLTKFRQITYQHKGPPTHFLVLTGNPPVLKNIDCMQLVMKRELWLSEGGWYDKSECSDGVLYQQFTAKYGYRTVGPILGEHY